MKSKLFLATLVSYLGIYITMPVLSALATKAHFIPSQIGMMVSLGALAMLLFAPLWGKLSDRFSRRSVMLIGLLGMSIGFALSVGLFKVAVSATSNVSLFVVGLMATRFFLGIFMTTTPTAANAYMADISSSVERAKDMAMLGFATGLAMVLGPIIGGSLAALGSLYLPFYTTIVMLVIAVVVLSVMLPKTSISTMTHQTEKQTKSGVMSFKLLGWLAVGCSVMFVIVGLQLLTSLYIHDMLGQSVVVSAKTAALLFIVLGVSLMLTQILQIKVFGFSARRMMTIGIPVMIVGVLIIMLSSSLLLMIMGYAIVGAGAAFGMSSLAAGASLAVAAHHQGAAAGAVAMTQAIAGIAAPLLGSFLYQVTPKLPFIFFCGFAAVAYVLFLFVNRMQR